jgi:hypothetical protein
MNNETNRLAMTEPTPQQQKLANRLVDMNKGFAEAANRAAAAYLPAAQAFNQGLVNLAEALRRAKLR